MFKIKILGLVCCILLFCQVGFAAEKIGVVDIQSIVNQSFEVKALKTEHTRQMEDLNRIVTNAQNAIAKENDPQKIIQLQDKYTSEFNSKKAEIDRVYSQKLSSIEERLKSQIAQSAKKHNYDLVLEKNMVFYGGEDITSVISKDIR